MGVQGVGEGDVQGGGRVGEAQFEYAAAVGIRVVRGPGEGRAGCGGGARLVAVVGRGAGPAVGLGGPDGEAAGDVGGVVEDRGLGGQAQGCQVVGGEVAQVGSPVQDAGAPVR